jgi:hypothetical protein
VIFSHHQVVVASGGIVVASHDITGTRCRVEMTGATRANDYRVGTSSRRDKVSDALDGGSGDRVGASGIKAGIGTLGVVSCVLMVEGV